MSTEGIGKNTSFLLHFSALGFNMYAEVVMNVESYLEQYVYAGGFMMYFLIPTSLLAVAWVFQGFIRLRRGRVLPRRLLLAASQTFASLGYALVLAAEGSALIVWGGLTRVRRRAVMGLVAVTTALLLGVLIPVLDEVRHGLAGGTWLIIGAVAAVVMIGAGSVIEKQRVRIGERLSRWEEILEGWE